MAKLSLNTDQRYALKDAIVAHIRATVPQLTPAMVQDNKGYYTKAVLEMPISVAKLNSLHIVKLNTKKEIITLESVFEEDEAVHTARLVRLELEKELIQLKPFV